MLQLNFHLAEPSHQTRPVSFLLILGIGLCACGAKTGLEVPDGSPDALMDRAMDAPIEPICVPGSFAIEPSGADVVFVIDRSGSMQFNFAGADGVPRSEWRWTFMRSAMARAFERLDSRVRVGAEFYPDSVPEPGSAAEACFNRPASALLEVPLGPNGRASILNVFDTQTPIGGTPTATAIGVAAANLREQRGERRFIVLATDGAPNCSTTPDEPQAICTCTGIDQFACRTEDMGVFACLDGIDTVSTIASTFASGIPIYVIGIDDPSRPEFINVLNNMADAGGRARTGGISRYYSVRSSVQLDEAVDAIAQSISVCSFISPSVPPSDEFVRIELNGNVVPADPINGWQWTNRAAGELEFRGDVCEALQNADVPVVTLIVDECGGDQ